MANSKITITFNREAVDGEFILLKRRLISDPSIISIDGELFRNATRTASGNIATVLASTFPGYVLGSNTNYVYNYYFNIDYNGYGLYILPNPDTNMWSNQLVIELTNPDWEFFEFDALFGTAVIENAPAPTFYLIGEPTYSMATVGNQCDFIKATIQTSVLATKLSVNGTVVNANNTNNPAFIEFPRGIGYYFTLEDATGQIIHFPTLYGVPFPRGYFDFLSAGNITVAVTKAIIGATVTINVKDTAGLILEYSLGDGNWQSSNIFTGQAVGDYVGWVRDQFNCFKSVNYSVTEFGSRAPYLFISEANSLSFKERVDIDNCGIYKNDTNTLSYESDADVVFCDEILFQTCDITKIQIHSNFTTIIPTLRKEDGTEVVLPITKKTTNLNRFARMDAWVYGYNSEYAGIYFVDGWIYDQYGAQVEEYFLGGNLPDLAIVGQYVTIIGIGTFLIEDVIYDEIMNKKALIVKYTHTGLPTTVIVESTYDLIQFEVYEFAINWSVYGIGLYDVVLEFQDPENGSVFMMSENIDVAENQVGTVAIRYFNENNRDIFYKFGIENFIRIPLISKTVAPKDETEINITDDGTDVIKSSVHESHEFSFDSVSETLMMKIALALSCENVFINNIAYGKDGSVNVSNEPLTNSYFLTAKMIKKGFNYTGNRSGEADKIFNDGGFNIPAFVIGNDGFIKT